MILLIITRIVDKNSSNAGFIYNWVKKIGETVDKLIVICQEQGDISGLPENVKIYSLGKKTGAGKLKQLIRFKLLLLRLVPKADGVFSHMMPIYSIIAGPFCKIYHKKLIQWYTHKSTDWKLKLANLFVFEFATASKLSFRLKTRKKINILGHGIDTELFKPLNYKLPTTNYKLFSIGRISPSKDYESIIKAVYELHQQGLNNINLTIIGDVSLQPQRVYFDNLKQMVKKMQFEKSVEFLGAMPNSRIPQYLQESDLFINLSDTGSLDKAVLEAMACECLVLTSNEAFQEILPAELLTQKDNPKILAQNIKALINLSPEKKQQLEKQLRQEVVNNHNLDNLAKKIVKLYES
ncbi:hypothetical protein COW86_05180 [Candidatus Kuenenbacteria bacterium CG22_combo_CG10-13_8_21_14_all_39_9]|uniref:Glycosyl transferase family 1 domain-containing protein n=1 Tax=Candidatus Kuenenbacteria bacterium CG22_combo_CG10-13_8_21_14_all_39_9 TaxID=1974621 RepID=A0A2H0CZ60_9BACT|nr:MAG: hypothetical protein COW86_05180 [Candidatus Kuenenbacteria bacterium CG22_combo_CG10-13_8_21_14_all_39_9]